MNNTYPQHRIALYNCRGFSLVELMVALVITLILLGGISQIFLSSKKSFVVQNTLSRLQENGRYAVDTITADLRRAGYWGGNADISQITGTLGTTDDDGTCATGDTTWSRMIDRRIYGLNDISAGYACITDFSQGDTVVVRYASPWILGSTTLPGIATDINNRDRVFLRSSLFAGRVFKGEDADLQDNDMDLDTSTPPRPAERVSELIANAYYIGSSAANQCHGINVPTLRRVSLGTNGQPGVNEIALGVEQLQVRYGLRKPDPADPSNQNKYTIEFRDADAVGTEWDDVVAARFWLLTRTECPETGYTNTNTYTMGDVVYDPDPDDGFRRQLYQATVFLRNR